MESCRIQQPLERSIRKMKLESLRLVKAGPGQCRKLMEKGSRKSDGEEKRNIPFRWNKTEKI